MKVDVKKNREKSAYTKKELLMRVVWGCFGRLLFRIVPEPFKRARRFILISFGAVIGQNVHIARTADVFFPWMLRVGEDSAIGPNVTIYNLGMVDIGKRVGISYKAHICAGSHDYRDSKMPLLRPQTSIGDDCWLCTDCFIGPGVVVGKSTIVGARAVVSKSFGDNLVLVGNPARSRVRDKT